jgi:hypothetical protein
MIKSHTIIVLVASDGERPLLQVHLLVSPQVVIVS